MHPEHQFFERVPSAMLQSTRQQQQQQRQQSLRTVWCCPTCAAHQCKINQRDSRRTGFSSDDKHLPNSCSSHQSSHSTSHLNSPIEFQIEQQMNQNNRNNLCAATSNLHSRFPRLFLFLSALIGMLLIANTMVMANPVPAPFNKNEYPTIDLRVSCSKK